MREVYRPQRPSWQGTGKKRRHRFMKFTAQEVMSMEHKGSQRALIILDGVEGVGALIGMVMLLTGWGYRFPISWLQGTPFSDYAVPALILGIVVGGSALLGMWATVRSASVGAVTSLVAGVIAMGWIVGEYVLVPAIRFDFANPAAALQHGNQQPLWFLIGLAMAVLALRVVPGGWRGMLHEAHLA